MTPTQQVVIDFLNRHPDQHLVLYPDNGRVDWSPWWRNPKYYPDGNPRCTAGTFRALVRRGLLKRVRTVVSQLREDRRVVRIVRQYYRPPGATESDE